MITKERLTELADKNTICKVSHEERVTLASELLALRQQLETVKPEQGDGWIEWRGGERPVHAHVKVEVKHRDSLCASTAGRAHNFDWNHYGYKFGPDIIAYRIIPEQPTNQNGEQ